MIALNYLFAFVVLLSVLIFVHELGHFLVAKACGVRVLKFCLGFVSIFFDILFMVQHYVLYTDRTDDAAGPLAREDESSYGTEPLSININEPLVATGAGSKRVVRTSQDEAAEAR